ncbi:MAG: FAD-dependent oxidoreductase, partial [Acidobacteriota bacterium]
VRLGRHVTLSGLLQNGFDAVYLGIGAMTGKNLGVAGDRLEGNVDALDLLRPNHHRQPFDARGKQALVVGGGDAAVDAARTLVRLGAGSVTIVYRRSREEMPAHPEQVDEAAAEGVEILTRRAPLEVLGTERVEGLRVVATEPGPPDESGRRSPVVVAGTETDLAADLVVAAIGQRPDLTCLDVALEMSEDGFVAVDPETAKTSMAGVFAGGDVTPGPKTVIHAIADGRRAAFGIDLHLAPEGAVVAPMEFVDPTGLSFYVPQTLSAEPSHRAGLRAATERAVDHDDVVVPLTEQQAREEAARCLLCAMCRSCSACTDLFGCPAFREEDGQIVIDELLCNGCGVCVTLCPNGAIYAVDEA